MNLSDLRERLREFARERDWEQFHSPKNLAMALAVEAGELMEHFQWLTGDGSRSLPAPVLAEVEEEVADVLIYLTRLADELGIDPLLAAAMKLEKNAAKYPADRSRGRADKYTKLP